VSVELGARGEDRAARLLESKGYAILARNFRAKFGELDLVARLGELVVFVEVRQRSRSRFGGAAESVVWSKRRKLVRTAQLYVQRHALDCPMRFDVVAIDGDSVEHIEGAFEAF
jgi:putative endonuclease